MVGKENVKSTKWKCPIFQEKVLEDIQRNIDKQRINKKLANQLILYLIREKLKERI